MRRRYHGVRDPGYRLSRGAVLYAIRNAAGQLLRDPNRRPIVWSDRSGLTFRSRGEALALLERLFVGLHAAREMGIRIGRV